MNTKSDHTPVDDVNIGGIEPLLAPTDLKHQAPLSSRAAATVLENRRSVNAILRGDQSRLLVIVGPCSIHDPAAAMDYARRLAELATQVSDQLLLVMRVYFEKPRTSVGWKGLINDPHLDDSFDVPTGLLTARQLLLDINELGLPIATEALDPIAPAYLQDLISWSAIGARTAESQTHREMASGLSCAVGFKNGTDGTLDVAINALKSVAAPHRFLGITQQGAVAVIRTEGNDNAHIVLRGGTAGPNFDASSIAGCEHELNKLDASFAAAQGIVVDCSHANSGSDHNQQPSVAQALVEQMLDGNRSIRGLMLESNLCAGSQPLKAGRKAELVYGQSVTDACIDWATTEELIRSIAQQSQAPLQQRLVT